MSSILRLLPRLPSPSRLVPRTKMEKLSPRSSSSSLILPFFFLLFCNFLCSAVEESQILLQIKAEWGNPPSLSSWTNSSSFSSYHCDWNGVVCNSGLVISLSLRDQGIIGGIPSFICDLRNLSTLDLYNNSIGGEFPISLYGCKSLSKLVLAQNLFVGVIPDDIGSFSSLKSLDLSYNNFSGDVPASIYSISGLRELKLESNLLNGTFYKELGLMAELEYLSLANNPFSPTKIPLEFGGMQKLKFLWISDASLIGEIPGTIGNLTDLEHLDLSGNMLDGEIPQNILRLPNLQNLYLYDNHLSGEIGNISALKLSEIDLSKNNLSGSIPEDIGNLINLRVLALYMNQLSGQIPNGIIKLHFLSDIRLFNNHLSGVLPPELGQNSTLIYLEISGNKLQGELPRNLCAKGKLNSVAAFDNQLSGDIPENLAHCDSLAYIQIKNNHFSGEIPSGIWSLPKLDYLLIDDNEFAGDLPEKFPESLSRINIANNRFSGRIPSYSPSLKVLIASNNEISGELPLNFSAISNLQELHLDQNNISGPIPPQIETLTFLTWLNLSKNHLTGEIPLQIASLPALTLLDLSNNQLSGKIPPELGTLSLVFLNLSSNFLFGEVPKSLENSVYNISFLSNAGLCTSSISPLNLPTCGGGGGISSEVPPKWILALIPILAVLAIFTLSFFLYLKQRNQKPYSKYPTSWNFTAFQTLDFTESTILNSLHPRNLIGSGGSGQVFRVQTSRSSVAVKQIQSPNSQEFLSEVKILASLRHTNIIKLLSFASSEDSMLLVYEFMTNGSLADHLQILDWGKKLNIAVDVARALSYMHHDCNPLIVHRDVKSRNILLDSEFKAKVADFGLARIMKRGEVEVTVTSLAGSVGYMAPECAYSTKVNEKADVYGFGVVLLELVTGRVAGEEGTCLVEWARKSFLDNDLSFLDGEEKETKEAVLRLGLFCTGDMPSARPTMKEVLQVLLRLAGKDDFRQVITVGMDTRDKAPLLKYERKMKSSRRKGSSEEEDEELQKERYLGRGR